MKKTGKTLCRALALLLVMMSLLSMPALAATVQEDTTIPMTDAKELREEWKQDQDVVLADPAPWNLAELKKVVDVQDPRSVAAYWVWAVNRLVDDYNDGMAMMKYLFADLEPYGRGFTEGGKAGRAGWDTYFTERLSNDQYKWLPRAYFDGANADNGFKPTLPLTIGLYYNNTNTETVNAQSLEQYGRLNIVYWVKSYAGGNQVNITLSKFEGSDRWYVTSGASSAALFYDQSNALGKTMAEQTAALKRIAAIKLDESTAAEHEAFYAQAQPGQITPGNDKVQEAATPFTDVPESGLYADAVAWAYQNKVTTGTTETTFGTKDECTRGQVVTFLWRAAGEPEPKSAENPFRDVSADAYYYKPVLWAVEQHITGGTAADTFSPDQICSSAHIITFLYRAMGAGSDGWYAEARAWALGKGLLEGTDITVSPEETCPRGDVAAFLYRAYGK